MSRILRRPMFRGGRVDSRGTGITTGLDRPGMQGGGLPPTGNPRFINLGGSGGASSPFTGRALMNVPQPGTGRTIYSSPTSSMPQQPRGLTYRGIFDALKTGGKGMLGRLAPFNPFSAAGVTMAAPFLPSYLIAQANKPRTIEALEYMKQMNSSGVFDETAGPGDYEAFTAEFDRLNKEGTPLGTEITLEDGTTVTPGLTTGTDTLATVIDNITKNKQKENAKQNLENLNLATGNNNNEEESLDIEANKELFAKLLGRDKAKGQDISDMLLSFSSKALAPEADVKSAFAEFAADEVKRPSRVQKIDDSAAALAINDYIAGRKSKAEVDALIKKLEVQKDLSAPSLYDNIIKIAGPGSNPTVANLETALKTTEDTRRKKVTRIPKSENETYKLEAGDADSFIIKEATKEIFYVDNNLNETRVY